MDGLFLTRRFLGAHQVALKGQVGTSLVTQNLLWSNGAETEAVARVQDVLRALPGFAAVHHGLRAGSAAVDARRLIRSAF